jgi:hypothetical protein
MLSAPVNRRTNPQAQPNPIETVLWGFAVTAYALCLYVITWRALIKLLQGDTRWAKTKRNSELAEVPAAASAHSITG